AHFQSSRNILAFRSPALRSPAAAECMAENIAEKVGGVAGGAKLELCAARPGTGAKAGKRIGTGAVEALEPFLALGGDLPAIEGSAPFGIADNLICAADLRELRLGIGIVPVLVGMVTFGEL